MAGMIPGVGVPSRKKVLNLMQNDVHIRHTKRLFKLSIFESSMVAETSMDLDETALKARQRLEMKLYRPSSRFCFLIDLSYSSSPLNFFELSLQLII